LFSISKAKFFLLQLGGHRLDLTNLRNSPKNQKPSFLVVQFKLSFPHFFWLILYSLLPGLILFILNHQLFFIESEHIKDLPFFYIFLLINLSKMLILSFFRFKILAYSLFEISIVIFGRFFHLSFTSIVMLFYQYFYMLYDMLCPLLIYTYYSYHCH
jgi:hypothetical protein